MNEDFETEKLNLCKFLKEEFGYNAKITSSPVNCDIRVPDKKIRIQIARVSNLEDDVIFFLGTKRENETKWRLTRSDYIVITDPSHYYFVPSKVLRELVEINNWNWKRDYRIESRKNPRAVLIKVPKSFIIYGLLATNDIQIFNKSENKKTSRLKVEEVVK